MRKKKEKKTVFATCIAAIFVGEYRATSFAGKKKLLNPIFFEYTITVNACVFGYKGMPYTHSHMLINILKHTPDSFGT